MFTTSKKLKFGSLFAIFTLFSITAFAEVRVTFSSPVEIRDLEGNTLVDEAESAELTGQEGAIIYSKDGIVRIRYDQILPSDRKLIFDVEAIEKSKILATETELQRKEKERQESENIQKRKIEEEDKQFAEEKNRTFIALTFFIAIVILLGWLIIAASKAFGGGAMVAVFGILIAGFFAAFFDTTVPVQVGTSRKIERVYNLQKGNARLGGIISGVGIAAVGAIFALRRRHSS